METLQERMGSTFLAVTPVGFDRMSSNSSVMSTKSWGEAEVAAATERQTRELLHLLEVQVRRSRRGHMVTCCVVT